MQNSMKLRSVHVENFRAIESVTVPLDPALTVLHGDNAHGKTSLLAAIAVGLGVIPTALASTGGITFRKTDRRSGTRDALVRLETVDGLTWQRYESRSGYLIRSDPGSPPGTRTIIRWLRNLAETVERDARTTIPVFAFYDTNRAVFDLPERKRGFQKSSERFAAYVGALPPKTSFRSLLQWFYEHENNELRIQRQEVNFEARLPALDAVRNAIIGMMPNVSNPHIESPVRFVVQWNDPDGRSENLSLYQLSGGYRIVLALAADLALRMALANPHLSAPLQSEAMVLIDEVELHLHPEWQQRILADLHRTFPDTQFIVSTHSPQVLSSVELEHILHLRATANGIVAEQETGPTFGARAGDVLGTAMGVGQRVPNAFSEQLKAYQTLVSRGHGETAEASALRAELDRLSRDDPALAAADVEVARRKMMAEIAGCR
jgi:predicted ATP-binding protein involved in virulence